MERQQLNLGEIIAKLESLDLDYDDKKAKHIEFAFGTAIPTTFDSWRGVYAHLALGYALTGYDDDDNHFGDTDSKEFLQLCKDTVGKTFEGWKGGDFYMRENTPVWIANPGNAGETVIYDITDEGWKIVIHTMHKKY